MTLIAAVDNCWGIGREGKLLFSIPGDLARFRALTTGHTILLGRNTLQTFPGGMPLPGRKNVVLTHDPGSLPEGCVGITSPEEFSPAKGEEVFLVGGASVYHALLERCDRAIITRVDTVCEADAFLDNLDRLPGWYPEEESSVYIHEGLRYRFCVYRRRKNP